MKTNRKTRWVDFVKCDRNGSNFQDFDNCPLNRRWPLNVGCLYMIKTSPSNWRRMIEKKKVRQGELDPGSMKSSVMTIVRNVVIIYVFVAIPSLKHRYSTLHEWMCRRLWCSRLESSLLCIYLLLNLETQNGILDPWAHHANSLPYPDTNYPWRH